MPPDLATIDALIDALHATISGPKDQPRDWPRFRALFVPEARLVRVVASDDPGNAAIEVMDVDSFIRMVESELLINDFHEREAARRVEAFGRIAQVFSTYESRVAEAGPTFQRGLNSFQLFRSADGWRFVSVLWDFERPDCPIPDRYLPEPSRTAPP